jgi:hypothetical protein
MAQEINKSMGEVVKLLCNKCSNRTSHKVLVSVENTGVDGSEEYGIHWSLQAQILECLGCQDMSYRTISSNDQDYVHDDDGETIYIEDQTLYPPRMAGRKGLENAYDVPREIIGLYLETHQALLGNSPVLTGIGLRALLEAICKERNAKGGDLYGKIANLVEQRVLTPHGAEVLQHIRSLGNQAAHEAKPHKVEQLSLAMEVIEHLILDVYIIPAKTKRLFGTDKQV